MARPTVQIAEIANGYVVTVYPQPNSNGLPGGMSVEQFCADKDAVAAFLISQLVPGATYTPPIPTT